MDTLHVLGTGNATVTRCFNTCFALNLNNNWVLTDCGGGNGIITQLEKAKINLSHIHDIFITHEHCDHILGVVWLVRLIAAGIHRGRYQGNLRIYCHSELVQTIKTLCNLTLQKKMTALFDNRIFILPVQDTETRTIAEHTFTFFDIGSTKARQFGYTVSLTNGTVLTFMGDEPVSPHCEKYAEKAHWLLCEAFCLYDEADRFKPYEKNHSTAKDAALLAQRLQVKNLLLWHTEQSDLSHRKQRYTAEAAQYFSGNIAVPDDLEVIPL
ncbi:MAG: MBL fold metallo-hydrolase [Oscillospiraceae bacterium]|nr:MBL fold metallo-hydrolase [Oscillospiraceae bacterium]